MPTNKGLSPPPPVTASVDGGAAARGGPCCNVVVGTFGSVGAVGAAALVGAALVGGDVVTWDTGVEVTVVVVASVVVVPAAVVVVPSALVVDPSWHGCCVASQLTSPDGPSDECTTNVMVWLLVWSQVALVM